MTCPVNGPRVISEFAYGGELRTMPDPATASDVVWADYVFNRNSVPGGEAGVVVPHAQWRLVHRRTGHRDGYDTAHLPLPRLRPP